MPRPIKVVEIGTEFGYFVTIALPYVPIGKKDAHVECRCTLCDEPKLMRLNNLKRGDSKKCSKCRVLAVPGKAPIAVECADGRVFRSANEAAKALFVDKSAVIRAINQPRGGFVAGVHVFKKGTLKIGPRKTGVA